VRALTSEKRIREEMKMKTNYTVDYYMEDDYKAGDYIQNMDWSNLMLMLSIQFRDQTIHHVRNAWNNVTIWEWHKDGRQELLVSGYEGFKGNADI
jgi:hypothetical protein